MMLIVMESLEEMGKKAYQKQVFELYREAIDIYSVAIKKHGEDKRFLNNRCMCYIKLKDYTNAMKDADKLVKYHPKYKKSFYRQGEIMKLLKRYPLAETAFLEVLKLDPSCEEARQQLLETQILEICSNHPFTELQAADALNATGTVEDAVALLKLGEFDISCYDTDLQDDDVYHSDDETPVSTVTENKAYDPLTDPSNPFGSCTLWIGNITAAVTEKMLKELFSKHGTILSVHVYPERTCAFINYKDCSSPGKAMKAMQGRTIAGKEILIKFPDRVANNAAEAATHKKKR
ncbi:uncharacterized protein LOC126251987 isoform X2 [Schistocerca nitens]|uniref:uncharacterized protein LOC126251987 isoform X2 n=1 Tax=Schistocerca nitens TaxID=7011 RepID=UPI0021188207|nr:uncharacterized protein LOC126251987 isoform X2 [Schistocerca nitens]